MPASEEDKTKAFKLYNIFRSKKLIIRPVYADYKLDSIWRNYLETIGVKLYENPTITELVHSNLSLCVPDPDHRFPLMMVCLSSTILVPRNLADKILMLGGLP